MTVQNVNPRLTPALNLELVQFQVAEFNKKHPVGSTVWWRTSFAFGPTFVVQIASPATIEPADPEAARPVVALSGVPGSVSIFNIYTPDESKLTEWRPGPLDPVPANVAQCQSLIHRVQESIKRWRNPLFAELGDEANLRAAKEQLEQAVACLGLALGEGN